MSLIQVLEHKLENVTLGVIDKNPELKTELGSVTFKDLFDGIHTVNYHKDGPFKDAEAVITAFYDGVLHTFDSHEAAASYERDRGNHEIAEKLGALHKSEAPADDTREGERY